MALYPIYPMSTLFLRIVMIFMLQFGSTNWLKNFDKQSNGGGSPSIKDYKPSFDGGGGFPFGPASALTAAAQAI